MALNAKIIGNGSQTLVLAHGYGGSQASWDNIVPSFSDKYRVVVFDWSFSGAVVDDPSAEFDESRYSSYHAFADDLISLFDEMGLHDVLFVGHSMSGMIGCIASPQKARPLQQARARCSLSKVINSHVNSPLFIVSALREGTYRYINEEGYEGGAEKSGIDDMLASIESDFGRWAEGFLPVAFGTDAPRLIDKFGADFKRMRPENALAVARVIFLGDYRDVLGRVTAPCVLVHGTNDVAVPLSVGHYMRSTIKGEAALEVVEMDGHFPHSTAPEKLIAVLRRSLE